MSLASNLSGGLLNTGFGVSPTLIFIVMFTGLIFALLINFGTYRTMRIMPVIIGLFMMMVAGLGVFQSFTDVFVEDNAQGVTGDSHTGNEILNTNDFSVPYQPEWNQTETIKEIEEDTNFEDWSILD